jgi:uncharacterized protein (TIGR03437 family)
MFCLAFLSSVEAQPVVPANGVMNAASYGVLQATGAGIAPGSIFVVFGSGLGPEMLLRSEYPLKTDLAGTSIRIGETPAFLLYSLATQVAAVAPSALVPGTYPLTVTFNQRTSQPVPVRVVATDFGIFARNLAGYNQAAAQTVLPDGSMPVLGLSMSVRPGEPIVLYGTGLGAITGTPDDRPTGAARTSVGVEVVIGGKTVTPGYAGRSPAYAGLDQINFTVPADLAPACYVPLAVVANGRLSNIVSAPVTQSSRYCAHPFELSRSALERLDGGGPIMAALALMERHSAPGRVSEGAGIGFAEMTADDVETFVTPSPDPHDGPREAGSCVVLPSELSRTVPFRPSVGRPRYVDAGPAVRLSGPSYSVDLARTPGSGYGANLTPSGPSILRAGMWTYSGTGGADIGPFRAEVDLADAIAWTNHRERIDPKSPLRVEWTGGGTEPVRISVSAGVQVAGGTQTGIVVCTARVQDGSFTIPAEILAALPTGSMGGVTISQRRARTAFQIPLARGGTADGALAQVNDQASGPIQVP